ncbi:hypothetical protein [Salegentibacter salegens]|uniref:Uncharacterized protein n=1 Tax=Salegentibacter salegens TaxID=143223 RepID=A0A1M7JAN0_9FLAO|nr:hypothetical protein [Salegentibacter salegens]PRX38737.1 hypothetical protein LY58_03489 [Salegentibacter salegens]SHM49961.1 hypothetical protein SAMN05878281_0882 [Salegentibacter salegens]
MKLINNPIQTEFILHSRVESFLLMYMNQYQLVLGSDLESYDKSQKLFSKNNPCNIYIVLRRPKVTVDPNSIQVKGNRAKIGYFGVMVPPVSVKQCHFKRYCNYIKN